MLYAKSTGGFYDEAINGDSIPSDATNESTWSCTHAQLLEGQSAGKCITDDMDGKPILTDPPVPTPNQTIVSQVVELEASVTDRRIREAVLGIDSGWLKALNDQIATLRSKLK